MTSHERAEPELERTLARFPDSANLSKGYRSDQSISLSNPILTFALSQQPVSLALRNLCRGLYASPALRRGVLDLSL
jgi:hypothetical protein